VQVFANLLNNAAKFTPHRGLIELEVVREGDAIVKVFVRDSGVGIPDTMLEEVFDMFTQVDRSHTHTGSGLGIGLTLVRRLVELHGGTVVAQCPESGGSEFVVRLPLARQRQRIRKAAAATEADLEPIRRRRILVADDNVDGARTLAMMLEVMGHEVVTAHDGEQALSAAMEFRPDVMVLDIAMPGFDGHAVARCIREEPWGKTVLMIAASGWGMPEHKRESRDAGFDHHMVKPVDLKALEALLDG
jgi:CheY-like chemotaxis protein